MGTKMYILVEADKSHGDPLSRLMTQLVDQLKDDGKTDKPSSKPSSKPQIAQYFSDIDDRLPISEIPTCKPKKCDSLEPVHHHSKHHSSSDHHPLEKIHVLECQPTSHTSDKSHHKDGFRSITAEASFDSHGCAKAKVSVTTDKGKKEEALSFNPCQLKKIEEHSREHTREHKDEYASCGRRNGLDPTPAELRGQLCFKYLPLKSKIPEYKCKLRTDNLRGQHSRDSMGYGGCKPKLTETYKLECPRNIPQAKLAKYNACIARRDGLQDKCDGLSKHTLKTCCKTKRS